MDWLRSEDLKEENNVTASVVIIAVEALLLAKTRYQVQNPSMSSIKRDVKKKVLPRPSKSRRASWRTGCSKSSC
jgi:hypothetical protein